MKRFTFPFFALMALVMSVVYTSCKEDEDLESITDPDISISTTVNLDVIVISYDIDPGSLTQESQKELIDYLKKPYSIGSDGEKDLSELLHRSLAIPLERKLTEMANAVGCYDFSVNIKAFYSKDPDKIIYTETVAPVIVD